MAELMDWLMATTGWSMSTAITVIFFVSTLLLAVARRIFSHLKSGHDRSKEPIPPEDGHDIIKLIQQQAPDVFTTSELAQISRLTQLFPAQFNGKVSVKSVDADTTSVDGDYGDEDQVIEHLSADSERVSRSGPTIVVDNMRVNLDANGKPSNVVINGQTIDFIDHLR